jgi:maleylacetoacetate isomerase
MSAEFILHDYFRSTASFRVRMALAFKDLDYELKEVHLVKDGGAQHKVDYLAKNPFALVPTLEHGDFVLSQSMAILEYLESIYPQPNLFPESAKLRAEIMSFCYSIICDIHPLNNLRVLKYLQRDFQVDDTSKMQWYFHWLHTGFQGIEKVLEKQGQSYSFGDSFSVADLCLTAQVYNAVRFEFDLAAYPRIARIYQQCCELSFVQAVHPDTYS